LHPETEEPIKKQRKRTKRIRFNQLPVEIIDKIFSYLPDRALKNAMLASSFLKDVITQNQELVKRIKTERIDISVGKIKEWLRNNANMSNFVQSITLHGMATNHSIMYRLFQAATETELLNVTRVQALGTGHSEFWQTMSSSLLQLRILHIAALNSKNIVHLRCPELTTIVVESISPTEESFWQEFRKNNPKLIRIAYKSCGSNITVIKRYVSNVEVIK